MVKRVLCNSTTCKPRKKTVMKLAFSGKTNDGWAEGYRCPVCEYEVVVIV